MENQEGKRQKMAEIKGAPSQNRGKSEICFGIFCTPPGLFPIGDLAFHGSPPVKMILFLPILPWGAGPVCIWD
jgi:hypothetical protein